MRSAHRSSLRGKQSKCTSHTHTHTHPQACTQTHSNIIDFLNTSILYGHCQMKTHSNRLEANVIWGKNVLLSAPAAACKPLRVHSGVAAGKSFLCVESFRAMAPKILMLYFVVRSTFSLWFYSFLSFGICRVKSTLPERRSRWSRGFFPAHAPLVRRWHIYFTSHFLKDLILKWKIQSNVFINFICIKY